MSTQSKQGEIDDRLAAVEAALLALMKSIAPKAKVVMVNKGILSDAELHDEHKSREQRDHESILARLAAIQNSLVNFASFPFGDPILPGDDLPPVGGNCRWEQVVVSYRCVKWGSTGNGGTAKCLEYEPIYESRWICD